jgi:hypothetical protein
MLTAVAITRHSILPMTEITGIMQRRRLTILQIAASHHLALNILQVLTVVAEEVTALVALSVSAAVAQTRRTACPGPVQTLSTCKTEVTRIGTAVGHLRTHRRTRSNQ